MISPLAFVHPEAVLGAQVEVHPFAYIDKNVVLGDNNVVMPYASILSGARVGNGNTIYQGAVVSAVPQDFTFMGEESLARIGDNNVIREHVIINRATNSTGCTVIGDNNTLLEAAHISHDVQLGNDCVIGNGTQISGGSRIDDHVIISSNVLVKQFCHIGCCSLIQGGLHFSRNVPPYIVVSHVPAVFGGVNTTLLRRYGFSEEQIVDITNCYRIIYQSNSSLFDALNKIEQQIVVRPEIRNVITFIRNSKEIIH